MILENRSTLKKNYIGGRPIQWGGVLQRGAGEAGGVLEGLPARERQDVPMTQSQRSVNTNANANTIQRWPIL